MDAHSLLQNWLREIIKIYLTDADEASTLGARQSENIIMHKFTSSFLEFSLVDLLNYGGILMKSPNLYPSVILNESKSRYRRRRCGTK